MNKHKVKYKQTQKELFPSEEDLESGLTNGRKLYPNTDANAYLVYKNGKLNSLLTEIGKSELEQLLKDVTKITEVCSEKNIRGCMDPQSINYNEEAIIDDGNSSGNKIKTIIRTIITTIITITTTIIIT